MEDVLKQTPLRPAPRIIFFPGKYYLVVENNVIFEANDCVKALFLCFSMYYVFNLEYSKPVKEFLIFIQECVLGLPDKSKKGSTYLAITSDFCKFLP